MHEYSIVQALIARVEQEVMARNAWSVERLVVQIGTLSGVEPELLATAYDTFKERTVCDGAQLVIDRVEARWRCPECGSEAGREATLLCARCGGPLQLAAGDEIILQRIEMEVL